MVFYLEYSPNFEFRGFIREGRKQKALPEKLVKNIIMNKFGITHRGKYVYFPKIGELYSADKFFNIKNLIKTKILMEVG